MVLCIYKLPPIDNSLEALVLGISTGALVVSTIIYSLENKISSVVGQVVSIVGLIAIFSLIGKPSVFTLTFGVAVMAITFAGIVKIHRNFEIK